jgi:transketolase
MTETATAAGGPPLTAARPVATAPTVSAPFGSALVAAGDQRPEVVVLSADLSKYTDVAPFAHAYPNRFFQVGMAEQNMMGIAGGLAKTGFIPVAVTYGVFATRRAGEQVQMALATGGGTAVVAAFLPGLTTPFRATHQATDDLAIMRAVPGMTVIDPVDATELAAAVHAAVSAGGPVYLRAERGEVPEIVPPGTGFEIGRTLLLRDGADAGLIGTGLGTRWALEAAEILASRGVEAAVLHVPTLKPLDTGAVAGFAARFGSVVTLENHSIIGGLGSAVCEAVAEAGLGCRVRRRGVPDVWAPAAGPLDYLRHELGLDAGSVADSILTTLGAR